MKDSSLRYKLRGILAPLFMIAADQLTKYLAVKDLKGTAPREIIPGLLGLSYVENRGMSFGLLQGQRWLFVAVTVVICLFLIYVYFRIPEKKRFNALSVCILFIFSGAVGNFIDRVLGDEHADTVDVYEALDMTLPGLFAYRSLLQGGVPVDVPDLRDRATRERYRNDTLCTDPAAAGDMLVPPYSRGELEIDPSVYEKVRKKFLEEMEKGEFRPE